MLSHLKKKNNNFFPKYGCLLTINTNKYSCKIAQLRFHLTVLRPINECIGFAEDIYTLHRNLCETEDYFQVIIHFVPRFF